METKKLVKIGHSLGVIIPNNLSSLLSLRAGNKVFIKINEKENDIKNREIVVIKISWSSEENAISEIKRDGLFDD